MVRKHDRGSTNHIKMRGTSASMVVLLILIANNCRMTQSFGLDMIGNIQTTANFFNDAFSVIKGDLPITALLTGSTGPMLDKILDSVGDISGKIDDLSASFTTELKTSDMRNAKRFNAVQAAIEKVMVEIPMKGKLNEDMREFRSYATRVNSLYSEFEYYSKNKTNFNEESISYFIEAAVSRNRGDLFDILQQMFSLVIQEDWYYAQGILELYAHSIKTTDPRKLCGVGLSSQVRYYKMYETIYMAEARGFIMQLFAFSVKSAYTRKTYIGELNLAKMQMLGRIEKYFLAAMNYMQGLQKTIELCDAPKYNPGIDYVTVERPLPMEQENKHYIPKSSISLIKKKANVDENMVVSGVRFVKRPSGMIDYQIKEAKLLPQGQVAPNGIWKELPKLNEEDLKIFVDYCVVNHDDLFYIDDIQLDPEYVVVGVDLDSDREFHENHNAIRLLICGMKFDAEAGQLLPGSEKWTSITSIKSILSEPYYRRARIPKTLGRGDPTQASRNDIDSEPNQEFSFYSTDEGHLIPFFDARPVEMSIPNFALTGMGIYHRGATGYGGFFNFRLYNIDLAEFMQKHDTIESSTDNSTNANPPH